MAENRFSPPENHKPYWKNVTWAGMITSGLCSTFLAQVGPHSGQPDFGHLNDYRKLPLIKFFQLLVVVETVGLQNFKDLEL